ncbi:ParB N-terminal domain-containing protein [Vibrio astriarenae]|uniref:ParB N-terminal domain-containing protein n=1 Tax=Vibrio astriarenae TaxID=1481923 RepID=UPI0037357A08
MLRLVSLTKIKPSTYNPRKADPQRLDILELSIRKLGFLLPLFADKSGEILSGHQRHHVCERMGISQAPIKYTEPMSLADRKGLNIAFNRGTNDLDMADTPVNMTEALARANLQEAAAKLPDKKESDKDFFRCLYSKSVSVDRLVDANRGRWVNYARNMARMLYGKGVTMPLVCTPDDKVVNGIGRLQYAAEKKWPRIEVVYISYEEADLCHAMLNLLSMDFDIHNRYEDLLRFNSFRRARRTRTELGQGFIFAVAPALRSRHFDIHDPKSARLWKKTHGTAIVDFGAGHLTETEILRSIGVNVTPFEPYRLGENSEINKEESVAIARLFLDTISKGKRFTSIFISSVLNSVPFEEDRKKIVCLCAALCDEKTHLYAAASSVTGSTSLRMVQGVGGLAERQTTYATFALDYEEGITIGDFQEKPKVQKYHTPSEFYDLFKHYFKTVNVQDRNNNVRAVCKTLNRGAIMRDLRKAIEFEFDLPYPDGSRMGLVDEALRAYSKRLGVDL